MTIIFFQPSDSRKSTSSDSGVVSPAENAEDRQLMPNPVQTNASLPVQAEKKKATEERHVAASRKNTGRQTSGANKNSVKQVCNTIQRVSEIRMLHLVFRQFLETEIQFLSSGH